ASNKQRGYHGLRRSYASRSYASHQPAGFPGLRTLLVGLRGCAGFSDGRPELSGLLVAAVFQAVRSAIDTVVESVLTAGVARGECESAGPLRGDGESAGQFAGTSDRDVQVRHGPGAGGSLVRRENQTTSTDRGFHDQAHEASSLRTIGGCDR